MTPYVNETVREYQCEIRRKRSTVDYIFSIRQILENNREYNEVVLQVETLYSHEVYWTAT